MARNTFVSLTRPHSIIGSRALRAMLLATVAFGLSACAADGILEPFARTATNATGEPQGSPAGTLLRVARSARDSGDMATAVTVYKRVHELSPRRADVLVELGQALSALGAHNEAADVFRQALSMEPKNGDALRGLGNCLLAMNQPELALEQFLAALSIQEDPRIYNGMGVVHDMSGRHDSAQSSYRNGLNLAASDLNLRNNLALSLALAGKYDEGIDILGRLVSDPRAMPRHRQNLALIYGLSGRFAEAAALARVDFDEPTVQNNLAYYETLRAMSAEHRAAAVFGITVIAAPTATPAPTAKTSSQPASNRTLAAAGSRPGGTVVSSSLDEAEGSQRN